jgi:type I restriction enzyme S subunit
MTKVKIPKEWRRVPLHEIAEVRTGVAKGKTRLRNAVELPYLRVANVQDGHINLSVVKRISVEREQIERYSLRTGDILMTEGGDFDKLGRGDVWQGEIDPCLHQNHVFAVRAQPDWVDPRYLSALASSEYGRAYFLGCAKRTTNLASINSSQLKAFPVLLPPLPEQSRIHSVLSTWDHAIATTERLLANSRKQELALLEALAPGRKRFKGSREAWTKTTLKQIATIVVSSVNKKHEINERQVHLCNYTDVYYNHCITAQLKFMIATASEGEITKFGLRQGDVLITKDSETADDIAVAAYVRDEIADLVCGYHLAIVRPDLARVDSVFLHSYFNLTSTRAYFASKANGVTRFGLPISAIEDAPFLLPDIAEQRKIASVLSTCAEEIQRYTKQISALKSQKRVLSAQLLTGKRRVRLPELGTENAG